MESHWLSLLVAYYRKSSFRWLNYSTASALEPYFTSAVLVFLVHDYSIMSSLTVAFITKKTFPSLPQYHISQKPQYIHYLGKLIQTDLKSWLGWWGVYFLNSDIAFWSCHFPLADIQQRFYRCIDAAHNVHGQTSRLYFTDYPRLISKSASQHLGFKYFSTLAFLGEIKHSA